MRNVGGVYYAVRADYSKLKQDMLEAGNLVKRTAADVSRELNGAINADTASKSINSLITNLSSLTQYSSIVGKSLNGIGVELGSLNYITGVSSEKLAEFQGRLLEVRSAQTAEKALLSLTRQLGLTRTELQEVGTSFGVADTVINSVASKIKNFPSLSSKPLQTYADQMRALGSNFDTFYEKMAAAMGRGPSLKTFDSKQFWDAIVPSDVPMERIYEKIDEAFAGIGRYVQKPHIAKNPTYNRQFWDAILPSEVPLDAISGNIDAAFSQIESQVKRGQARLWLDNAAQANQAASQTTAILTSLLAQEAEASRGILAFESSVASSMAHVEDRLVMAAQAFNMPKQQVDQLRAKAQQQIELKVKTDALKQLVQDANLAEKEIAELERQFGAVLSEGSGLLGGKNFGDILKNTLLYGGAYQLLGWLQQMPNEFVRLNAEMETFQASFRGIFGQNAPAQFTYITAAANAYGKSVSSITDSYRKFAAATEYVGVSSGTTKDIFEATTQAITKIGGSSEDVKGSLLALQQALSKGTLSSEEFRLQFAERIPGAMKMGADALGVTESKFKAMLESGQIVSSEFIPKLASQLNLFSKGWEQTADTLISNWERFKNSLQQAVTSDNVTSGLSATLKAVTAVVDKWREYNAIKTNQSRAGDLIDRGLLDSKVSFYDPERLQKALDEYDSLTSTVDSKMSYVQKRMAEAGVSVEANLSDTVKQWYSILGQEAPEEPGLLKEFKKLQDQKYVETITQQLKELSATRDRNSKVGFFDQSVEDQIASVLSQLKAVKEYDGKTVRMLINIDTTPIQSALNMIQRLAGASAQSKVDAAQAVVDRVQQEYEIVKRGVTEAIKGEGEVRSAVAAVASKETQDRLRETEAALTQAKKDLSDKKEQLAKDQYEQTDAYKKYQNKYGGDLVNIGKLPLYGDISQADAALMKFQSHWQKLDVDFQNGKVADKALWTGRASVLAEYQGELDAIAKKQNAGANAAAHHAVAVEKLGDTLQNYLAKQFALVNDDQLGAKLSDVAKQADNLRSKAKDLAIAGGVDLETFFSDLDKATEDAKKKAGDDFLEKLFPELKKDDVLKAARIALDEQSASYKVLQKSAEGASMTMVDVRQRVEDQIAPLTAYQQSVMALKRVIDSVTNFSEYTNAFSKLRSLEYGPNGSEERKSQEELLTAYNEVTGKMYQLKADMYERIAEKARAVGLDEQKVQAILVEKTEEAARTMLETQVKYSSSFGETMASKWSLAFGGYESSATKARKSWDQTADGVISATNGMIDGISGGFGDLIRNIGNGTASIEDLWRNMLARMLDAFASFVEELVKSQLKNLIGGLFSGSDPAKSVQSAVSSISDMRDGGSGSSGGLSSLLGLGKSIGKGVVSAFSSGDSDASTFLKQLSDASGVEKAIQAASPSGYTALTSGASSAGALATSASGATSAASALGSIGSVLGVVGAIGGLVGLAVSLFGEKKEEAKKVASGYNVMYSGGKTVTSGVDFYNNGGVVSTGVGDPDVTRKISEAFKEAAENLSDFADVLGFTVDVLDGFTMPAMNITDDQVDTYIRNGTNAMAFQALEQAGLRGAFDALAEDGEVYIDEIERLSNAYKTGSGKLAAYGYDMVKAAQVTDEQIEALRAKTIETAAGTADATMAMAESMGATSDQLAILAANASDSSQALAVTNEQLSNLAVADWVSKVEDQVGGEDAFNAIMDNLLKNVFDTIDAYAENLDYYNSMAQKYIRQLGDNTVTVENFWEKFNEALKNGLDPEEFELWGKASTWVNSIDSVNDALEEWNHGMLQLNQSLDARMAAAGGFTYQATLTKQLAAAEQELYEARKAGYDAAYISRLQEVQAAELAATIRQHNEDYQKELLSATKRYATALDDQPKLIAIQMEENQRELQDMAKEFNWSVGSAEEGLFQALQQAQWAELINQIQEWSDAIADATTSLTSDIAARRASLNGLDAESEAIQKVASYQQELTKAYEDGVSQDLIDQLSQLQLDELADYWADAINDLNKELGNVGTALEDRLTDILDRFTDYTNGQLSSAQTALSVAQQAASSYKSASESIEDTVKSLKKSNAVADPKQNYQDALADWQETYAKALTGDISSLTDASTVADDLMSAAKDYFANSGLYEDTYASVIAQLSELDTISTSLGIAGDYQASLLEAQVELLTQINNELSQTNPDEVALQNMVAGLGVVSDLLAGTRNVYITDDATAPATRTAINELTGQTVQIGDLSLDQLQALQDYSQANVDATGEVVATTEDSNSYLATQQGLLASGNATQDILRQFSAQNISVSQEIKNAILGDASTANAYLSNVQSATTQMVSLLGEYLEISSEQAAAAQELLQQAQVAAAQSEAQTLYNQTVAALQNTTVGQITSGLATTGAGWGAISDLGVTGYDYTGGQSVYQYIASGEISSTDYVAWFLSNYGAGTGYVDWEGAISLLTSMGLLPSDVSSLYSQYQSAYAQYLSLKTQYGFAVGGVVPGASYTGDTVLAGLNSGERVLTAEQNRSFERLAYNSGSDGLVAEVKALREENKQISERMERYFFALTTSNANISKRVDDFWRRGIQTSATEA